MTDADFFATIRGARRIWAVGSIHGDAGRLQALHAALIPRLRSADRRVDLGNYLGYGAKIPETIRELLRFRRVFLARPPYTDVDDFIMLRGSQEEMWQRTLQLQFAVNPAEILEWMVARGVDATLRAYAGSAEEGFASAAEGPLALTQWTSALREAMRAAPGHMAFMSALKRAAFTEDGGLLFVNAGIDVSRPLERQADSFWWAGLSFDRIREPYAGYRRLVRGYDPGHGGFAEHPFTVTVDGGCGFGGPLVAACLEPTGEVVDRIDV
jgi:serine/threonine protein phosphatase 1